jgi:O-succinylbenzoate synthase
MRLTRATVYRYRLPLARPVNLGPQTIAHRDGALLEATVRRRGATAVGWGEIAPLPGFSTCSLHDALAAAEHWALASVGHDVVKPNAVAESNTASESNTVAKPDAVSKTVTLQHVRFPNMLPPDLPGPVRFGIESALLNAAAHATGASLPSVLGDAPRASVSLNALLDTQGDALQQGLARVRAAGFQTVKLKVGRASVADDVARVRAVIDGLGGAASLRLDANRAWSFDDAARFASSIPTASLQYLEEPLADPSRLAAWHAATGCPIALDETAREMDPAALFDAYPFACAVVVKPTLIGVRATRSWAEHAAQHNATVVLSSAYESGVGMRMVLALAATLTPRDVPAGLGTYRRLEGDVLAARLPISGGFVDLNAVFDEPSPVDTRCLDEVISVDAHA